MALWHELALYLSPKPCWVKEQTKLLEGHRFGLLGGVNLEYETICAQVLSQDPLPPVGMVFLQWEEVEETLCQSRTMIF